MDKKTQKIIRIILIITSMLFIAYGVYTIWSNIYGKIVTDVLDKTFEINQMLSDIKTGIFLIMIGMILFSIGKNWSNTFKSLTKILISIALLFLTLVIILYPLNTNSAELVNSIQPSIDYFSANSIDNILQKQIKLKNGTKINLTFSENTKIEKIYSKNMTSNQAKLFIDAFKIENRTADEKLLFAKFLVNSAYQQILTTKPETLNIAIPISMIKTTSQQQGLTLQNMNFNLLKEIYVPNNKAYLNIIISKNEITKIVTVGNLTNKNTNLIWSNLGFAKNISNESKAIILNMLLSQISIEFEKNHLQNISIPLTSISSSIPADMKNLAKYDLFVNNLTKRTKNLEKLRNDCEIKKINSKQICQIALTTKYSNLMKILENSSQSNITLPMNLSSNLKNIDTIKKLNTYLKNKSDNWPFFLILGIIFFMLASLSYYAHFKLFKRKLITVHIPYYISKINFYQYIPTFILMALLYYILVGNGLFVLIKTLFPIGIAKEILIIKNTEIFSIIVKISNSIFFLAIFYFILSLIFYLIFYFFLKNNIENNYIENEKENGY